MTTKNESAVDLIDYGTAVDMLWSGVARIEPMTGGLLRYVGYVEESPEAGRIRWVRAGNLVVPVVMIPKLCAMTAEALERGGSYQLPEAERILMM